MPTPLTIQYNRNYVDLHNAKQRLKQEYTEEKALLVERLQTKNDRLILEIRSTGPTVADIQGDDCVLL
jgi:LytS/YehU family sensor histidine kinase